jgi:outer membrane protein TolC
VQGAAELHVQELALQLKSPFPDLPLVAPPELEEPSSLSGPDEQWMHRILDDNHEIALADGQLEQSKLSARRAQLNRMPDPTVGLRYSNNLDGNDRLVSVIVSVPIGGSRRSAEEAVARRESNIAAQHARATRLKVEGEAQRSVLAARSTYVRWQRLRAVSTQSEAGAVAVARGYELGEFSITDLLTARRQALDAKLAATSAQLDALEAASRLRLDAHEIWPAEERVIGD